MATKNKRKLKKFTVCVREEYSKAYEVMAYDEDEAYEKADDLASDDDDLAIPENFVDRDITVEE